MVFSRGASRKSAEAEVVSTSNDAASGQIFSEGNLKFTLEQGGNEALPTYQEVSGAPVESVSPWVTTWVRSPSSSSTLVR